jgi:hypothetical protein
LCGQCCSKIGRGKQHVCKEIVRNNNLVKMATECVSSKSTEKIVSGLLKNQESCSSQPIYLSTSTGRRLPVLIGPSSTKKNLHSLSVDNVLKIKSSLNLSDNETLKLTTHLRRASVRSIAPNLKAKLTEKNYELAPFFEKLSNVSFSAKGSNNVLRSVVYCKNVEELVKLVVDKRALSRYYNIKIGIDGGGGFLKVCVNVIDKINVLDERNNSSNDSGVKKLIILGIVCDIEENYYNVSLLWNILKLDEFIKENDNVTVACDLKMANILTGLMSHSSAHPCTWCNTKKAELDRCGRSRTLTDNENNYKNWLDDGGDTKKAKFFLNCVGMPLFKPRHEQENVLDIIPPPELHLMLGVVNYLYTKMYQEFAAVCEKWVKFYSVEREAFYGGCFNGNSCRRLLSNIDYLCSISPIGCLKYVQCLSSFEKVVTSCFGKDLDHKYIKIIETFKNDFLVLNSSVTPKLHAIFFHIPQFCEKEQKGLGFFCEQASEAVHSDFKKTTKLLQITQNFVSVFLQQ